MLFTSASERPKWHPTSLRGEHDHPSLIIADSKTRRHDTVGDFPCALLLAFSGVNVVGLQFCHLLLLVLPSADATVQDSE